MSRLLRPDEIANLVWWLCGDDARVLHGAVLDASMGLGAHPGLLTGHQPDGPAPPDAPVTPLDAPPAHDAAAGHDALGRAD
jgi:hypothetical protein